MLKLHPMPLVCVPEPFDHEQFVFELKHDGFRAPAIIRGHHSELVSRHGHVYKSISSPANWLTRFGLTRRP